MYRELDGQGKREVSQAGASDTSPVPMDRVGHACPGSRCSRRSSGFKVALPQAVCIFHGAGLRSRADEESSIPDGFDAISPAIRDFQVIVDGRADFHRGAYRFLILSFEFLFIARRVCRLDD
ncbi:hypothetical protein [Burkholderia plantarii]|uniref:hypothetical protein n=1 Tax=Burkholderia plantarii TaxID=41899 RepID=UPI0018DC10B3|nr:hypothetical protein [Burkholderia plantarii]MBI0326096.1 hypothetical protein [Burkholderia plantarii]